MDIPSTCACGVAIGKLHKEGCDWEECPICHAQMIMCNCDIPVRLSMSLAEAREFEATGYLSETHSAQWEVILNEAGGRVPHGSEIRWNRKEIIKVPDY